MTYLSKFLPLLAALLAAGCSLHQPQAITPPAYPEVFVNASPEKNPPPVVDRWWQSFADPQLDALINEALARNLDLAQALARQQQAEALLQGAESARRPSLNLDGQVRRERNETSLGPFTGSSRRLSLAANYEIDLWQKLQQRRNAAELEVAASAADLQTLALSLAAQITDLYYLAAEQRRQIALADATSAAFADTLERVERRYREGLVPPLDIYQARQSLAAARARRPQFETTLAVSEHALAVLAGGYPAGASLSAAATLPELAPELPQLLPSELLLRRPDISAALQRLQASDARIGAAIAERFPAFNLGGALGHAETALISGDLSGVFWNLLLNLSAPLLDGGRRQAEVERSEAVFREQLARYHKSVLSAFQEVEDALAKNRSSAHRLQLLAEREAAAAASLRLALDRYLQGLTDYLPVLTSQGLQLDAEGQLLAARRQLISDRIALHRALGGDWMAEALAESNNQPTAEGIKP